MYLEMYGFGTLSFPFYQNPFGIEVPKLCKFYISKNLISSEPGEGYIKSEPCTLNCFVKIRQTCFFSRVVYNILLFLLIIHVR